MFFTNPFGLVLFSLVLIQINGGIIQKKCSKSCLNGGFCLESVEKSQCYCLPEWEGEYCHLRKNFIATYKLKSSNQLLRNSYRNGPCSFAPDLCLNGGICFVNDTTLACACQEAWGGSRCDEKSVCLDYCYNGGVCTIASDNNPNCTCTASYTGVRCQSIQTTTSTVPPTTTTDPMCKYMPSGYCKNNASCIIQNGVFACYCLPSYTGKYCELSSGGPGPTANPGVTNPGVTNPGVTNPGVTNPSGSLTVGSCATNPCANNRPCYESGNSYYCYCGSSYSGNNCQTPIG